MTSIFNHRYTLKLSLRNFATTLLIAILWPNVGHSASLVRDFPDSHVTLRFGSLTYTNTDGAETISGGGTTLNYEYSRQMNLSSALVLGWRQTTDAKTQRDGYHSAYGGYRMFPFGLGIPITSSVGDAVISMDSSYKLYGEASVGLGRMLFKPNDADAAAEYSADSLTVSFGGGMMMHFFSRMGVDFQVMYHIIQARGGTANSLLLSGNGMSILFGSSYLF